MSNKRTSPTSGTQYGARGLSPYNRRIVRFEVMKRCGNKCVNCSSTNNLTLDHIIEASNGGRFEVFNLQILCYDCNQIKANPNYQRGRRSRSKV